MSAYPTVTFRDGKSAPGIAFGAGTTHHRSNCVNEIKTALKAGFTSLDLAEVYQTSQYVGEAIRDVDRASLFITTKAGEGMKDVAKSLDQELKALGIESVDLFMLHWAHDFDRPNRRKPDWPTMEEAWKAMIEVKKSGKAKSIGVSNFRVRDLQKLMSCSELPVINQIEYHPFLYSVTEEVVEFCAKHDIKLAAYSATAPITRFSGVSTKFNEELESITSSVSERSGQEAQTHQILLKLASQRGFMVVTTSSKEFRMKEQLAAGSLRDLTHEDIDRLVAAAEPSPQRAFEEHMGELDVEY